MNTTTARSDKIGTRASSLVQDTGDKVRALGDRSVAQYRETLTRLQRRLRRARVSLTDLQHTGSHNARVTARRVNYYAHENPWKTAAAAAALAAIAVATTVLIFRR
jgi:ElaB/YqjD/DUF883 family membrane-anchored ribosome-binding protein